MREAEAVELQGEAVDEVDTSSGGVSARQGDVLRWAADTYMRVRGFISPGFGLVFGLDGEQRRGEGRGPAGMHVRTGRLPAAL